MVFHSEGRVVSRCQRLGVGNICISTGFAQLAPRKVGEGLAGSAPQKKSGKVPAGA